MKKIMIAVGMIVVAGALVATPSMANATSDHKVTICHANEGIKGWSPNGNNVDKDSIMNPLGAGHDSHANDIIPAFDAGPHANTSWDAYPGKNLSTSFDGVLGSVILANGCKVPVTEPPTPTVVTIQASIDHSDACGPNNLVVNLPESTDGVLWVKAIADPDNTVLVTATAQQGYILTVNGETTAEFFSWTFTDSDEVCSTDDPTPTPVPSITPVVPVSELAYTGLSPIGEWLALGALAGLLVGLLALMATRSRK